MAKITGPNGHVADVDTENRLQTFAIVQNEDRHAATEERIWSIYVSITPTDVNDKFFYLKNTGIKDLFITDISVSSSVVTQLIYKHVIGVAVGGADAEVTNRKLGNVSLPNAIIQESVDFTGLTDVGRFLFEECDIPNSRKDLRIFSTIVIPQGQAVAFERVAATGLITMVISLSEDEF